MMNYFRNIGNEIRNITKKTLEFLVVGAVALPLIFGTGYSLSGCNSGGEEPVARTETTQPTGDDDNGNYVDDTGEDDDSVYENTTTISPTTTWNGSSTSTSSTWEGSTTSVPTGNTTTTLECFRPIESGIQITQNTLFCPGEYVLPSNDRFAAIYIVGDNTILDCNGSTIRGNGLCKPKSSGEGFDGGVGIAIEGANSGIILRNCNIEEYCIGINVGLSFDLEIYNNTLKNNPSIDHHGYGDNIQIVSGENINFHENVISGGFNEGVYLSFQPKNVRIFNNFIRNVNGNGIACAEGCDSILIENNLIENVGGDGIDLSSLNGGSICDNQLYSNLSNGIRLSGVNNFRINQNIIIGTNNFNYLVSITNGTSGIIWNNFLDIPTLNRGVYDNGQNSWNGPVVYGLENIVGGANTGGNFFSNYSGVDNNGDGFFDAPYHIPGGSSFDNYPLVLVNSPLNKK